MSLSPAEVEREVERNYSHNFLVNALDGTFYWFGYSFIAPTIILPLYLSHFTSNPILIGLIPTLHTACFLIPQLFTSNVIERAPLKKIFPVTIGFFTERLPIFLLAPSALLFAKSNPVMAMLAFFILYTWYSIGAGLIIVGWQDMIAKIIPVDRRGRFFGITNFAGNMAGIVGALAVPFVMEKYDFPQGYVMAFAMASVLIFISWYWLSRVREPAVPNSKPRVSQLQYFRSLPALVRQDANFSRYLVFQIANALSSMAAGFLVVYGADHWDLSDSQASWFIIAMQVGQALSNLFFGFLADRKGHKLSLEISVLCSVLSFALAFFAPLPIWFFLVFFLRGATFAGAMISGIAIVMEFSRPEDRPTYIGLANTIPGAFSAAAPIIGGWLAVALGYPIVFVISSVIGLAAYAILHWSVREPRRSGIAVVEEAVTVS